MKQVIFDVYGLFCAVKLYVRFTAFRVRFISHPKSYSCFCQTVEDFDVSRVGVWRAYIPWKAVYFVGILISLCRCELVHWFVRPCFLLSVVFNYTVSSWDCIASVKEEWMSMEHWWDDADRAKSKYSEKDMSQWQFVHHKFDKPSWDWS